MQALEERQVLMRRGAPTMRNIGIAGFLFAIFAAVNGNLVYADSKDSGNGSLVIQADFPGLVMTGVAYSVSKELDIFNVRPLIPMYDIRAASASLAYNAQTWPAGTVFVSVVDPGVGTDRKSVVLKTKNGLFFVSPDNGSLSGPAKAYGIAGVREIDETVNRIPGSEWSHTFHGRDVYSYTGARLAAGVIGFEGVGQLLDSEVITLESPLGRLEYGVLYGIVSGGTGRLGNISFNIDRHLFAQMTPAYGEIYDVIIRNKKELVWRGSVPYTKSFGDVPVGKNMLFVNSSGKLSIAINQGNFANTYNIESGTDWTIEIEKQ
jgi:S-adenosylmethionine hydrolase